MSEMSNEIFSEICKIVGNENASMRKLDREVYSHDISPLPGVFGLVFDTLPDIVVRPGNSQEVSNIVKVAYKKQIPVIPRGAGTWGLGGAVPAFGGIVLDMTRMNKIHSIDKDNLCITAEPGVTWKKIDDFAAKNSLGLGAYPSSAPAATVGGWLGTGGVGLGTYKYGGAGDQVRTLEVVLPDGRIIETGFEKVANNSTGFDLTRLFVGSEGTLGIITKATIKLRPKPKSTNVFAFDFSELEDACMSIRKIVHSNLRPWHLGFFDSDHYRFLNLTENSKFTCDFKIRLIIVFEGEKEIVENECNICKNIIEKCKGREVDKEETIKCWEERYYEFRAKHLGPTVVPYEVFVPVSGINEAIEQTEKLAKSLKLTIGIGATLCDENTVALMPYYFSDESKVVRFLSHLSFTKKLADMSISLGGHPAGLGLFYAPFLAKRERENVLEPMTDIKCALDPKNIMNPGKLIESSTRYGFNIPPFAFRAGLEMFALASKILPRQEIKMVENKEGKET